MRITLVCASGLTTNLLAKKLNDYSNKMGYNDSFSAIKVNFYSDVMNDTNIFCIAPQAELLSKSLQYNAKTNGIKIIYLEETDLVFGNVEKIYEQINNYRVVVEDNMMVKEITFSEIFQMILNALTRCIPIALLGFISWLVIYFFDSSTAKILFGISFGMFPFYIAFALGYEYGILTNDSEIAYGLLFLLSSSFILDMNTIKELPNELLNLENGLIPMLGQGTNNYILLIIILALTTAINLFMRKIDFHHLARNNSHSQTMIEMPLKYGIVIIILLLLKIII